MMSKDPRPKLSQGDPAALCRTPSRPLPKRFSVLGLGVTGVAVARFLAERGVDVQVVLPGHCLRDVTKIEQLEDEALASVDGFGKKRLARYGSTLLDVLRAADAA